MIGRFTCRMGNKIVTGAIVAFLIINLYIFYHKLAVFDRFTTRSHASRDVTVAILFAQARSGSTFLADVLDHHPDTLYLHEATNPHLFLRTSPSWGNSSSPYRSLLGTLLSATADCDFRRLGPAWFAYMIDPRLHMLSRSKAVIDHVTRLPPVCTAGFASADFPSVVPQSEGGVKCRPATVADLTVSQLNDICGNRTLRLVKLVSHHPLATHMSALDDARTARVDALKPKPHFKLIHLVRDPRAVIASRRRLHWDVVSRDLCANMSRDLSSIRLVPMSAYLLVRYEDLIDEFEASARRLFAFLGRSVTPSVERRVNHLWTRQGGEIEEAFNTIRQSPARLVNAWRSQLTTLELRRVEEQCANVLALYGYSK